MITDDDLLNDLADIYDWEETLPILDKLRERLRALRAYSEAADSIIFDPEGIPVLPHDFMPARRKYREMQEREKCQEKPTNTMEQ